MTDMMELTQQAKRDKLRYAIFGSQQSHEVWLIHTPRDGDWKIINRFTSRKEARAAVARYLHARDIAKQIGCRLS